jgi:hypothetical protein
MAVYNSWKDLFEIEKRITIGAVQKSSWFRTIFGTDGFEPKTEERWFIVDKCTNEVVGKYDDYYYAINRAKYKFKRKMRSIDRMLLG